MVVALSHPHVLHIPMHCNEMFAYMHASNVGFSFHTNIQSLGYVVMFPITGAGLM